MDNTNYTVNISPLNAREKCIKLILPSHSTIGQIGEQCLPKSIDVQLVAWYYANRYGVPVPLVQTSVTLSELLSFPYFGFNFLRSQFDLFYEVGTSHKVNTGLAQAKVPSSQVAPKLNDGLYGGENEREKKIEKKGDLWDDLLEIQKHLPERD